MRKAQRVMKGTQSIYEGNFVSANKNRPSIWDNLPNQLSEQENIQLIKAYKQSKDEKVGNEIRNKIVLGNLGIAKLVYEKIMRKKVESLPTEFSEKQNQKVVLDEDFFQNASLSILHAIDSFDLDMGAKFYTHLKREIYGGNIRSPKQVKTIQRDKNAESLNKMIKLNIDGDVESLEGTIADVTSLPQDWDFDLEYQFILEKLVPKLPQHEAKLFLEYYANGKSMPEIAKELGITRQAVSSNLQKILQKVVLLYNQGSLEKPILEINGKKYYYADLKRHIIFLDERKQQILKMLYVYGKTPDEIAKEKGISINVVRKNIGDAKRALEKTVQKFGKGTNKDQENLIDFTTKVFSKLPLREKQLFLDIKNCSKLRVVQAERRISFFRLKRYLYKVFLECDKNKIEVPDFVVEKFAEGETNPKAKEIIHSKTFEQMLDCLDESKQKVVLDYLSGMRANENMQKNNVTIFAYRKAISTSQQYCNILNIPFPEKIKASDKIKQ